MENDMATATPEGATPETPLERIEALLGPEEAEETTEQVEETPEDSATDDAEESVEEETTEATPEEDAQAETSEIDISTAASLLGFDESDVSVDDDGNLLVRVKVDGEETWAKPADIRKGYQLEGHANKKSMEASELQKQLKSQQEKLQQEHQAKLKEAESVIHLAAEELAGEYAKVNWDELRATDPQEWTAKQIEFQQRQDRLKQSWQKLSQERNQLTEAQQKQAEEYVAAEQKALREVVPEWSDDEKFETGKREVATYLKSQGFTPEQVSSVSDHRAVLMARKAMLYDQLQGKKPAIVKKVKQAPKLVKSGNRSDKERSDEALKKLRKGLRSGKRGAVASLLEASGKV